MKAKIFKEREKIRQVSHWDLDYLSREEVADLYAHPESQRPKPVTLNRTSTRAWLPWALIGAGILLLVIGLGVVPRL